MQRFDFSSFYLKESLSDVTLLIRIDGDVKQRLPGHGVVLANGEKSGTCSAVLSVLLEIGT